MVARIEFTKDGGVSPLKNQMTRHHESWYPLPIGNVEVPTGNILVKGP